MGDGEGEITSLREAGGKKGKGKTYALGKI